MCDKPYLKSLSFSYLKSIGRYKIKKKTVNSKTL